MIRLGVNSVLFKTVSFREAAEAIKKCGYDGVEISAIGGMCEHLDLANWKTQKAELIAIREELDLPFISTEVASQDRDRLLTAFEACAEIGIPIVNIGPGGKSDVEEDVQKSIAELNAAAELAEKYGITLCCKAHVNAAIYNTPTTLRMMEGVKSPAFGVDMDPSHILRSGENPVDALPQVISRVKHIHIRDCMKPVGGIGGAPGTPTIQTPGRAELDLLGYFKAMAAANYDGPVCLEVIGPQLSLENAIVVASEARGYLNALRKVACGE